MKSRLGNATSDLGTGVANLLQAPAALLLITGTLIGLNFPLGKIAGEAGVSPLIWAMLISLGATLVLLPILLATRMLALPPPRVLRYTGISAVVSFVTPNLLLFTVIPHTGAGYAGLMFALSPVFTLLFASLLGMKVPGRLGRFGIAVGLAGASLVSLTRGFDSNGPGIGWLLAAMAIPITLAAGNVYRTLDWPKGVSPNVLAFWGHAFSSALFLTLLLMTRGTVPLNEIAPAAGAALAQVLVAGMTFPAFFRLQQKGGPVLLSQIGYVAAAVGLIGATVFLGERYSAMTWLGAGVIVVGIGITIAAQRIDR
ncbi:MAG TPA: DMT family transporter [Gammaproteobacteria bacterium]|nr:DMT family transporter [Chromatiaceae bacterium]HPE79499.1 DMT family transporter [Gammaproteobacteria bacterium]